MHIKNRKFISILQIFRYVQSVWCYRIGSSPLSLHHYFALGRRQRPTRGIVSSQSRVCQVGISKHFVTVDDVEAMPIVILSLNSMSLQMVYLPNFAIKTEPKKQLSYRQVKWWFPIPEWWFLPIPASYRGLPLLSDGLPGIRNLRVSDLAKHIIDSNTDKRVPRLSHFCRGNQTRYRWKINTRMTCPAFCGRSKRSSRSYTSWRITEASSKAIRSLILRRSASCSARANARCAASANKGCSSASTSEPGACTCSPKCRSSSARCAAAENSNRWINKSVTYGT